MELGMIEQDHGNSIQHPQPTYRGPRSGASQPPTETAAAKTIAFPVTQQAIKLRRSWSVLTRPWTIVDWWRHYIDPLLTVQDELGHVIHDPRDFLALERTHLAFIRTCNVLALFGVTAAQLFVLKNADSLHGRWLAVSAYILAIILALVSAVRTIWLQDKIITGQTATSFWLFVIASSLVIGLLVAVLVFNART